MPKTAVRSNRRTGEETRALILTAAAIEFRDHGYDVATLDDVARHLGVTRSAVLHHYSSKLDLLREIVRPVSTAWDAMLDEAEAGPVTTGLHRRRLLAQMVELVFEHRDVTTILRGDVTARQALEPDLSQGQRLERMVSLLAPSGDLSARVHALAALGAIAQPVALLGELVDTAEVRNTLADCAYAALRA